jgi:hypothetical protein
MGPELAEWGRSMVQWGRSMLRPRWTRLAWEATAAVWSLRMSSRLPIVTVAIRTIFTTRHRSG